MSYLRWGLIALTAFLFALIVGAPAALVPPLLPKTVAVSGVSGSLWNGRAAAVMVQTPSGWFQLGQVDWRLHPLSLLTLGPTFSLATEWGEQRLQTRLTARPGGSLHISDLRAAVPAGLARQMAPVAITGEFRLDVKSLDIDDGLPVFVDGRAEWVRGGWLPRSGPQRIGDYVVSFSTGDNGVITGDVETVSGPLMATGVIRLEGADYRTDVSVTSDAPIDPGLRRSLDIFATPGGDGYRLQMEGRIGD